MSTELSTLPGLEDELMTKLFNEKRAAQDFQERRHEEWDENYELYRNKVFTNRLTQRQAVNVPLMKETVKTLLSKIDEPPNVEWKEKSGDQMKELILQEMWNLDFEDQNFEGIDIQDKKSVLLYGRAFKKLNWLGDEVDIRALDIYDVVVDPMTDPLDLETARFIIHQNIFRTLREILADDRYEKKGKDMLKTWLLSPEGMIQTEKNKEEWEKKMERLRSMGVNDDEFAMFSGGDVLVNISEHYTSIWNKEKKEFERRVIVYADDRYVLMDEKLEDLIGVEFWPFVTWSEDIETTDFWSDGPADLVRTPNKLVNVWLSQLTENRTLKNFQMHWYDASVQGYEPQTYEPGPGRMLPAPGNPNDVIKPVEISGLDDTLSAIEFIIKLVEKGSSATAIEKGTSERSNITLGEVNTLVGKALERTIAMAKFYRRSWKELAMKWYRLVDANLSDSKKLTKMSRKGKVWPKTVFPKDWKSDAGFKPLVSSSSEQEEEKTKAVQRFQFLISQFPENSALRRIGLRRMLDLADLTSEEMREIQEEEKQKIEEAEQQAEQQQAIIETIQGQSGVEERLGQVSGIVEDGDVQNRLNELINASEVNPTPEGARLDELARLLA